MAEFQEVARHWKRMCKKYWMSTTCHGCPIAEHAHYCEACSGIDIDISIMEEIIVAWAAENPEPVYPMWCEWLADKGVVDVARMPVDGSGGIVTEIKPSGKMYEHIPADIAQKLGIEQKEGE